MLNTIRSLLINDEHVFTTLHWSHTLSQKCEIQNENFAWYHRTKFYVLSGVEKKSGLERGYQRLNDFTLRHDPSYYKIKKALLQVWCSYISPQERNVLTIKLNGQNRTALLLVVNLEHIVSWPLAQNNKYFFFNVVCIAPGTVNIAWFLAFFVFRLNLKVFYFCRVSRLLYLRVRTV